jgi:hypothetical protein
LRKEGGLEMAISRKSMTEMTKRPIEDFCHLCHDFSGDSPLERDLVPCLCPECLQEFRGADRFERMGAHLEIHREKGLPSDRKGRRKLQTVPCPNGCGRWIPYPYGGPKTEFQAHTAVCTGRQFYPAPRPA